MKCPLTACRGDVKTWQAADLEPHCPSPTCTWRRCPKCKARVDVDHLRGFTWPTHDGPSAVFLIGEPNT